MFISGTTAGSAYKAMVSGRSSAVRGLIPKSTGGRMALGAGGALAVAGGVAMNRRRSSTNQDAMVQDMFRQDVLEQIRSGQIAAPPGTAAIQDMRTGKTYQL